MQNVTSADSGLLFKALFLNGIFSAISGIAATLFPAAIGAFIGFSNTPLLVSVGIALIGFGALLVYYARKGAIARSQAILITVLDLAWVLGTAAILLSAPSLFSGAGVTLLVVIAIVVFAFFEIQSYALWITRAA